MECVPISTLSPRLTSARASSAIRAVVTLLWPYSARTSSSSVLLAEPDARLRGRRGQVHVTFQDGAATAFADAHVQIGDEIQLELTGCVFQPAPAGPAEEGNDHDASFDTVGGIRTPGKCVNWELVFGRRLSAKVTRRGGEVAVLNVEHDQASSPRGLASPGPRVSAGISAPSSHGSWGSPAYLQKVRQAQGRHSLPLFDELGANDVIDSPSSKRRKLSYNWRRWTYVEKSPSPTKVIDPADEEDVVQATAIGRPDYIRTRGRAASSDSPVVIPPRPSPEDAAQERQLASALRSEDAAGGGQDAGPNMSKMQRLSLDTPSALAQATMPPPLLSIPSQETPMTGTPSASAGDDAPPKPRLEPVASPSLPLPSPFPDQQEASASYFARTPPRSQGDMIYPVSISEPLQENGKDGVQDESLNAIDAPILSESAASNLLAPQMTEHRSIIPDTVGSRLGIPGTAAIADATVSQPQNLRPTAQDEQRPHLDVEQIADESSRDEEAIPGGLPPESRKSTRLDRFHVDADQHEVNSDALLRVSEAEAEAEAEKSTNGSRADDRSSSMSALQTSSPGRPESSSVLPSDPFGPLADGLAKDLGRTNAADATAGDILRSNEPLDQAARNTFDHVSLPVPSPSETFGKPQSIEAAPKELPEPSDRIPMEVVLPANNQDGHLLTPATSQQTATASKTTPPASQNQLADPAENFMAMTPRATQRTPEARHKKQASRELSSSPLVVPKRTRATKRLSDVPQVLSPWFTDGNARESEEPKELMDPEDPKEAGLSPFSSATPMPTSPRPIAESLSQRTDATSGLRTDHSYYTPLAGLRPLLNAPANGLGKYVVDILAVVMRDSRKPLRASAGPRDWGTIFGVTDQFVESSRNEAHGRREEPGQEQTNIQVLVHRKTKLSLPTVRKGDVVLLRAFAVTSNKGACQLLSTDESGWAVWSGPTLRGNMASWAKPQMRGPPVEFGQGELQEVGALRSWWDRRISQQVIDSS